MGSYRVAQVLWLRQRSPEFVDKLLALPEVQESWVASMRARKLPTSALCFCCAATRLDALSGDERHAALFDALER